MKLFQTYLHKMTFFRNCKGQLISKANCQAKQTNEFVFTSMRQRHVFVCSLEEIEDSKKVFRYYLTFNSRINCPKFDLFNFSGKIHIKSRKT